MQAVIIANDSNIIFNIILLILKITFYSDVLFIEYVETIIWMRPISNDRLFISSKITRDDIDQSIELSKTIHKKLCLRTQNYSGTIRLILYAPFEILNVFELSVWSCFTTYGPVVSVIVGGIRNNNDNNNNIFL